MDVHYPAIATRLPISARSATKSTGLIGSASGRGAMQLRRQSDDFNFR
jgi:hypothetical protein